MKTSGAWIRPLSGDYLIFIIALAFLGWLFSHYWNWQAATRLQIHQGGQLIATLTLDQQRELSVSGPLGITRIEIDHGRARVHSSPCTNQYCVHQGWLSHAGQASFCLPNRVSIRLMGASSSYDSLNY